MKTSTLLRSKVVMAIVALASAIVPVQAQLVINQTQAPATLVQNFLMGPGVFASNVLFCGVPGNNVAPSAMSNGEIGRFNGSNSSVGLNSGIFLCTNNASYILGPNDQYMENAGGFPFAGTPDLDLSHLTGWPYWQTSGGGNIYSKSILEFDFIPTKDMISVRYVFTSEEYERWTCSQYNDAFGFFISGPGITGTFQNNAMNIALIPGSLKPVSINTVNSGLMNSNNANGPWFTPFQPCFDADPNWQANSQYYRYNGGQWPYAYPMSGAAQLEAPYNTDPYYIQHNGETIVLTASAAVQCGQSYHIKLALGNVGDWRVPSAVFFEQGSFTSSDRFSMSIAPGPNVEYTAADTVLIENNCDSVYLRFHRWGGFYLDEDLTITTGGTATAGVDYLPTLPSTVHFNQLDSTVIVPIAVPVDIDGLEDLIVNIITCNGTKIQTYTYPVDQRPPLIVDLEDQNLICPAVVTFTPVVTGGADDPAALTYLWSTGETSSSISPMVTATTQFWVTVSDSCWALPATDSAWVYLPNYDTLTIIVPADTAIPCLFTAELVAHGAGGAGSYSYTWTMLANTVSPDSTVIATPPFTPTWYVAEVTDACGQTASDSVLVSQAPPIPLVITLTPDTAIPCLGHADLVVTASGGGGVLSYSWTQGGSVIGTTPTINVPAGNGIIYTAEVSDQCGQVQSGIIMVTTGPTPPLVIAAEGDTVMCANMPLVLTVLNVFGGGGAYSYHWDIPTGGPNNTPSVEVTVPDDAYFTVSVTDECGNSADTTLAAVVQNFPPLALTMSGDTIVCPGEPVPLYVMVSGGAGGNTIVWPGIGSGPNVSWTAHGTGINAVVNVTDACGETISDTSAIGVFPAGADIHATQVTEVTWRFVAATVPQTGNVLDWDLGDGTTANTVIVDHTYTDYDQHWVVLSVTTPDGCIVKDSMIVEPPAATFFIPNSFSPDGDGINDTFGAEGSQVDKYELLVFDRWGEVIFESHEMTYRWDGTYKGQQVMQGVYAYRYRVEGRKMSYHQGFGHLTLIR